MNSLLVSRLSRPGLFLLLFLFLWGCPGTAPVTPPPAETLTEPEPPPDLEPARETLTSFLEARWTFDREAALEYVTAEDRENVWSPAFQPFVKQFFNQQIPYEEWYEWRIVELAAESQDVVIARVEALIPTTREAALLVMRSNLLRVKLMSSGRDFHKRMTRTAELSSILVPTRPLVTLEYRLIRVDDEWRVQMGWAHFPDRETMTRSPEQLSTDFEGSEKWWIERTRAYHASRDLSEDQEENVREVNRAEQLLRQRRFDEALAVYDKLLSEREAPDFVVERPTEIAEIRKGWERVLRDVDVELNASPPTSDSRGRVTFEITAKNTGTEELDQLRVGVRIEFDDASTWREGRFADLEPGTQQSLTMAARVRGKAVPRVASIEVTDVRFADRELQQDVPPRDDQDFREKLQDYRTGGSEAATSTRVVRRMRDHSDAIDACADWTAKPLFAWITVSPMGNIASVDLRGDPEPPETLESCVSDALSTVKVGESDEEWTVVVQLFPPDYWEFDE